MLPSMKTIERLSRITAEHEENEQSPGEQSYRIELGGYSLQRLLPKQTASPYDPLSYAHVSKQIPKPNKQIQPTNQPKKLQVKI